MQYQTGETAKVTPSKYPPDWADDEYDPDDDNERELYSFLP